MKYLIVKQLSIDNHFYGQPSQIYRKKNAKVRVERSPIFKDRFFLQYGNILGNGVKQNV
jgi:hypothetical protein